MKFLHIPRLTCIFITYNTDVQPVYCLGVQKDRLQTFGWSAAKRRLYLFPFSRDGGRGGAEQEKFLGGGKFIYICI